MVNYPKGIKAKRSNNCKRFDNRGMDFEYEINLSNKYYRINKIAIIYKKPTPIKVVEMDNTGKYIVKAFFEMPSTTDYNGIYKGKYIDFEAKETLNKLSFPLSNIHEHQLKHLEDVDAQGGIAFILVYFKKLDSIYILDIKSINCLTRKSIPLDYFEKLGVKVDVSFACPINYLKAVDILYRL